MYCLVLPQFESGVETQQFYSNVINQFCQGQWQKTIQNQFNIIPMVQQTSQMQQICHKNNMFYLYPNFSTPNMFVSTPQSYQIPCQILKQKNTFPQSFSQEEAKMDSKIDYQGQFMDESDKKQQVSKNRSIKKKKSETKNLIKNYGRAILTFILKNTKLRLKVLHHLSINDDQFLEAVYMFRSHIHTISAIRYLWQQHPFCKAFRILSCEYLRKHNLQHIFNSRVFKHSVYLKYQDKLMKSMQRPQQFQCIKQL